MKTTESIIKEFRERFVINVFGYPKAEEIEQFIKSALERVREEMIEEVFEMAHYYTEREILLMPNDQRMLAKQHNAKLDKLKANKSAKGINVLTKDMSTTPKDMPSEK